MTALAAVGFIALWFHGWATHAVFAMPNRTIVVRLLIWLAMTVTVFVAWILAVLIIGGA